MKIETQSADATNKYLYDAEGQVCATMNLLVGTMTGYIYDADGVRVAKGTISTMSCDITSNGFQPVSDYIIGPGGEQLTEVGSDGQGNMVWSHTNVFAGGSLIGTYDKDGLHFYLNDWLGNRRVQTDYAGVFEQSCTNLPFGDSLNCTESPVSPTEHHFTGKERDLESGNDYFGARYYASGMGRFLTPDWSAKVEPVPYAKLDNPQSLNLYGYVMDNPLGGVDADGHDWKDSVAALGQFVRDTTFKLTVGIGIGVTVNKVFHLEAAARAGIKLEGQEHPGRASGITENEFQASVLTKSKKDSPEKELGVGSTVEHTIRYVDVNTGESGGPEAPVVESSASLSKGGVSVSPSNGGVELQFSGEALAGGNISVGMPKAAIGDLGKAVKGITDYFTKPAPPPTPTPPPPPQQK